MPASAEAAYRGCEIRPIDLCRLLSRDEPDESAYAEPVHGDCAKGDMITVREEYNGVGSACVEYARDTWQIVKVALFSAVCSLIVIGPLSFLFNWLREPTERAIVGDWIQHTRQVLPDWCPCGGGRVKDAPKAKTFVSPQRLEKDNPVRLRKKGAAAALPFCSALVVGLACTMLIALVVVTFDQVRPALP
jgi:hypothetical protein